MTMKTKCLLSLFILSVLVSAIVISRHSRPDYGPKRAAVVEPSSEPLSHEQARSSAAETGKQVAPVEPIKRQRPPIISKRKSSVSENDSESEIVIRRNGKEIRLEKERERR